MRDKRINIDERTVRKMGLQELYSWDFLGLEGSWVEKIQNRSMQRKTPRTLYGYMMLWRSASG